MNYFVNNIHVDKLFHLKNLDIPIADEKYPHLIITGKNGSGKTILLNSIVNWFEKINETLQHLTSKDVKRLQSFLYFIESDKESQKTLEKFKSMLKDDRLLAENAFMTKLFDYYKVGYMKSRDVADNLQDAFFLSMKNQKDSEYYDIFQHYVVNYYNSVFCDFTGNNNVLQKIKNKEFVLAYYSAQRSNSELKMVEPKSPTKPELNTNVGIKETYTDKFLEFLSDLRIQGALARNEKQNKDADEIDAWFDSFVKLLQQIFQDDALKLEFDYKKYSFKICTENKKFKFTELADGFAAVLDIVADLILKMQKGDSLTRVYEKEGIVLIDEIETHLHLSLQKIIMPLLTQVFPNIQFIVTTHSPFVLSSMPNAVAYDLENKEPIKNLANYSYESLAEGYFGVRAESSDVRHRLNKIKELLEKKELTVSEQESLKYYIKDFDSIPEAVSPSLIGEYLQMKLKYVDKIKELMQ